MRGLGSRKDSSLAGHLLPQNQGSASEESIGRKGNGARWHSDRGLEMVDKNWMDLVNQAL